MFEDGARIDDIMNIFKPPTLDGNKDKKETRVNETGLRYFSKDEFRDGSVQIQFMGQNNSEVLR